jgi:hypothetical protein
LKPQELAVAVSDSASMRWAPVWICPGEPSRVLDRATVHYPQFRSSAWTWAR